MNTDPPSHAERRLGALYEALQDHELLTPMDERWVDTGSAVKGAFRTAFLNAFPADGLASQDEADSGIEEDARQARNFNALTAREEEYMALARSCSDGTLRQHCADYGMHSPEPARLRWLAGRCYILARRLEMGDPS